MTSGWSLAPWVLFLEQDIYLSYTNLDYENLYYKIYTIVLKNGMQKTLDAIRGGNQSAAIKNITTLHIFSNIWDIIDVSS